LVINMRDLRAFIMKIIRLDQQLQLLTSIIKQVLSMLLRIESNR